MVEETTVENTTPATEPEAQTAPAVPADETPATEVGEEKPE